MTEPAPLILVVEDEEKIASLLIDYLQTMGNYRTHWIGHGDEVLPWLASNDVALMVLDIMLPGMNGMDICKEVRRHSNLPIMMATARVEEIDRLLGLELGADDYICKPYSPREVVARVKAILRRSQGVSRPSDDALVIDRHAWQARYQGHDMQLTPVEFSLISHLAEQTGRVFSRQQLLDVIYSDHRIVNDRTVDTHIKNIRRKLETIDPETVRIESVYGIGYRLSN